MYTIQQDKIKVLFQLFESDIKNITVYNEAWNYSPRGTHFSGRLSHLFISESSEQRVCSKLIQESPKFLQGKRN